MYTKVYMGCCVFGLNCILMVFMGNVSCISVKVRVGKTCKHIVHPLGIKEFYLN